MHAPFKWLYGPCRSPLPARVPGVQDGRVGGTERGMVVVKVGARFPAAPGPRKPRPPAAPPPPSGSGRRAGRGAWAGSGGRSGRAPATRTPRAPAPSSRVTIKGRRSACRPAQSAAFHPLASLPPVAGQTSAANMVKQIESKVCPGQGAARGPRGRGRRWAGGGQAAAPHPGGRGRGGSAWGC